MQLGGQQPQQEHAQAKSRYIADKHEHRHQHRVHRAPYVGGDGPQHVANEPAHQNGGDLQAQRPDDGRADDVVDRAGVLGNGRAQIPAQGVAGKGKELLGQGFIQPKILGVLLHHLLAHAGVGDARRRLVYQHIHWVAGHEAGQQEVQKHGDDKRYHIPYDSVAVIFC